MRSSSTSHSLILDVHCSDRRAQRRPVGTPLWRKFPQLNSDLIERETYALRENNECDPSEYGSE